MIEVVPVIVSLYFEDPEMRASMSTKRDVTSPYLPMRTASSFGSAYKTITRAGKGKKVNTVEK